MRALILAIVAMQLVLMLGNPAKADLDSSQQAEARSLVKADLGIVLSNPAAAVVVFVAVANPDILEQLPEDGRDKCTDGDDGDAETEAACQALFQQIIEKVGAILVGSYGMSQSLGQFDPTSAPYSRDLTLSLLDID